MYVLIKNDLSLFQVHLTSCGLAGGMTLTIKIHLIHVIIMKISLQILASLELIYPEP
jgi:hypothetical protein